MDIQSNEVAARLNESVPGAITEAIEALGEVTLYIEPSRILDVCRHLKIEQKFLRLSGITGVDWFPESPRFEVVYLLHSPERNLRLRLKCRVGGERPSLESVTPVWRGANWYEREVYDMFGVEFSNHPNLRRILMPDDWAAHPLRKDYPVHGHKYSYQNE